MHLIEPKNKKGTAGTQSDSASVLFYPRNECLSPSKLTPHKGVCDEGKRPPKGGKKRPATAAGRSVDAQKEDGVGAKE